MLWFSLFGVFLVISYSYAALTVATSFSFKRSSFEFIFGCVCCSFGIVSPYTAKIDKNKLAANVTAYIDFLLMIDRLRI